MRFLSAAGAIPSDDIRISPVYRWHLYREFAIIVLIQVRCSSGRIPEFSRFMKRHNTFATALLIPLLILTGRASAVAQEETRYEFWPSVEAYYRFDAQWRAYGTVGLSQSRETQYTDASIGAYLDYSFLPIGPLITFEATEFERYRAFQIRTGVFLAEALGSHKGTYTETAVVVEPTARLYITEKILLVDRNRFEIRRLNGEGSWRYRNRIRVERLMVTELVTFSPYISFEALYDSREQTFNRLRTQAGAEWKLSEIVVLDTYYLYQSDSRSSPEHLHVLSVSLTMFL
jgi:hypothetical protein